MQNDEHLISQNNWIAQIFETHKTASFFPLLFLLVLLLFFLCISGFSVFPSLFEQKTIVRLFEFVYISSAVIHNSHFNDFFTFSFTSLKWDGFQFLFQVNLSDIGGFGADFIVLFEWYMISFRTCWIWSRTNMITQLNIQLTFILVLFLGGFDTIYLLKDFG